MSGSSGAECSGTEEWMPLELQRAGVEDNETKKQTNIKRYIVW